MQMEIRFASWTRAGKFRVTFVRRSNESHFRYRGGWAYIRIIQLQKCLARERDIYICMYSRSAEKSSKKREKKCPFSLGEGKKDFFTHQYRILSKPLFLSLSKTFTSRQGGDKKERS